MREPEGPQNRLSRLEKQERWRYNLVQAKSRALKDGTREDGCVCSRKERERICLPTLLCFTKPNHKSEAYPLVRVDALYSVHQVRYRSLPQTASQIHLEGMFASYLGISEAN